MTKEEKQAALQVGLEQQQKLMRNNAELMEELYPQKGRHIELNSAADITRAWIKDLPEHTGQQA
ncbi:MAG: hypothetical protein MK214_15090 [Thalassotalea sp.]|nr:hypothetical protein [Thalassotalea sp.]